MITVQGEARQPPAVVGASRAHFGAARDDSFGIKPEPSSLSLVSFKPHHDGREGSIFLIQFFLISYFLQSEYEFLIVS